MNILTNMNPENQRITILVSQQTTVAECAGHHFIWIKHLMSEPPHASQISSPV